MRFDRIVRSWLDGDSFFKLTEFGFRDREECQATAHAHLEFRENPSAGFVDTLPAGHMDIHL